MWKRIWDKWGSVVVDRPVSFLVSILETSTFDNYIFTLFSALYALAKWVWSIWENLSTWTESLAADHPVRLVFLVLLGAACFIIFFSFWFYDYNRDFWQNILVEAHGMLFDLLVISGFLFWLQRKGERRLTLRRYREEIEDFRSWKSDESMYRIVGNIKRLNREGISKIDLFWVHLVMADLVEVNLREADLRKADLTKAVLYKANLYQADLREADLNGTILHEADLRGADLTKAMNLTREQIQSAITNVCTKLPDYLTDQAPSPMDP